MCIVVGVLSRSKEFHLREWHRKRFEQAFPSSGISHKNMIQLRFPVAHDPQYSWAVVEEARKNNDILFLPINEGYRWLMANTLEFLESALHIFYKDEEKASQQTSHREYLSFGSSSCSSEIIIKVDSDVFINYLNLFTALNQLPPSSSSLYTYFGLIQSHFPASTRNVRQWTGTSYNELPPWAVGPFYGLSVSLARQLVRVRSTVVFADGDAMVPEEDRGIGIALQRSGILHDVSLWMMKGLYMFCNVPAMIHDIECEALPRDTIAVHVGWDMGWGWDGNGSRSDRLEMKLQRLLQLARRQEECIAPRSDNQTQKSGITSYLSPVDPSLSINETLFYQCPGRLQPKALEMARQLSSDHSQIKRQMNLKSHRECAEAVYRMNYPEVGNSTTSREHFLREGYKKGYLYFCPRERLELQQYQHCDKESRYLQSNPDIAQAVTAGSIPNGTWHYENYGKKEGRFWGCGARYREPGTGTTKDCHRIYSLFVNQTRQIVRRWPVAVTALPQKSREDTDKAVVFVEGRDHDWTDYVLRVARRYTGDDWMMVILNVIVEGGGGGPPLPPCQAKMKDQMPDAWGVCAGRFVFFTHI